MEISKFLKDKSTAYELKPITLENINKYDELVAKNNAYGYEGRLIHSHISTHPTNTDKDEVAMKIILIDFTNNTNINRQKKQNALDEISNAIINTPNFDEMLKNGDTKAVEIIASASEKNNFSFASKYCTYHSHTLGGDKYYIYDSLVQELLPFYAKIYGIKITESTIKGWKNSKNYTAFRNLMDEILRLNGLSDEVNIRRKFDHFLWWQGKEINEEIAKSKK